MKNVELKARRTSVARDRKTAAAAGATFTKRLKQRDTYFCAASGRLKLREQTPGNAELIAYVRPDRVHARVCDYFVVPVPEPRSVRKLLTACLGKLAEVKKTRDLYLRRGVRIHLDRVAGLGIFLEFEAVLTPGKTARWGRKEIADLSDAFTIQGADIVSGSYLDLVLARTS